MWTWYLSAKGRFSRRLLKFLPSMQRVNVESCRNLPVSLIFTLCWNLQSSLPITSRPVSWNICELMVNLVSKSELLKCNSVYPDQTPRSVASDLRLHCLPMSFLWDAGKNGLKVLFIFYIQSTLVISNSKGLSETLRDISTSTYQIFRIKEKIIRTTTFNKFICNWTLEVRDISKILWKRGEIAP